MPYVFRQTDLPKLDIQVDRGSDFEAWKEQWTSYCTLSGLAEESAVKQVQVLTLCLSRETLSIVNNLGLTEEQKKDPTVIIAAIKRHIDGHINESVERRNLRRRTQQPGESFDDFLVSLRELAKTCGFCSEQCMQKSIRDQIIEGSLDGDITENLLKQPDLTLDGAITLCRAQEAAKRQRSEMNSASSGAVFAIKQRQQPPTMPSQQHVQDVGQSHTVGVECAVLRMNNYATTATRWGILPEYVELREPHCPEHHHQPLLRPHRQHGPMTNSNAK